MARDHDFRWWMRDEDDAHTLVCSLLDRIELEDSARIQTYARHVRLYGGEDIQGLSAGQYFRVGDPNRITLNLIAAVVDAITARVTKSRPRPTFLTDGADWSKQREAKNLTRFMDGAFYETGAYDHRTQIYVDAATLGDGLQKVYSEGDKIIVERSFPWEVFVDPIESVYGTPRQLFQKRLIDRAVLKELYEDSADAIERSHHEDRHSRRYKDGSVADLVRVVEAWHLPSGPTAKDGRHVIAIPGATLHDKEWKRDHFPFARTKWAPRQIGFWSRGIAERLVGKQIEVNTLLLKFQEIYALWGKPWFLTPRGAKIQKAHITDELDTILEYSGLTKPEMVVFKLVAPEMYEHLRWIVQSAFEEVGINQMMLSGSKPPGVDAAVALRELDDIQSERLAPQHDAYQQGFLQLAELIIEEATAIKGYKVRSADRHEMQELDFSEIDLARDAYVMRMFPTSALSATPAYRIQQIKELTAEGWLGREDALKLLDLPDLDAYQERELAPYRVVEKLVERMLDDGEAAMPEPYFPIDWALRYSTAMYCWAKLRNAPEEHLELVRDWITGLEDLKMQATPTPAPASAVVPQMGAPMAPPAVDPAMAAPPGTPIQ